MQLEVGSCSRCSGTGLELLSWAIVHHLLFTSASAVWETLNQMAITTEIVLKVCEPQRGVPSGVVCRYSGQGSHSRIKVLVNGVCLEMGRAEPLTAASET